MLRDHTVVLAAFAGTLFLSALLLFSVQPLFAKMVLPSLGGSPSVWAVSLCFFQAALLAGYAYAHALNRYVAPQQALVVHLGLLAIAALTLPFGLPADLSPPIGDAYLWLVGVLTVGVGLPFFAVAANAPLLQAWYASTGHPHARDPYFLYGASNLGSLLALLAYPVVIEPMIGLSTQVTVWTAGFVLLTLSIGISGLLARVSAEPSIAPSTREVATRPVGMVDRLSWIGFAFVPSSLLVAFTSYVTTDVASAPFLWVTPLAAFLLTFVLVFRDQPLVSMRLLLLAQPILLVVVLANMTLSFLGTFSTLALQATLFFVTMLICHKQLYDARPDSAQLTEFYLWMSLGGVLGGIFAAIIAPQIFNNTYEYPLLLLIGLLCRGDVLSATRDPEMLEDARRTSMFGLAMLLVSVLVAAMTSTQGGLFLCGAVVLIATLLMYVDRHKPLSMLSHATVMVMAVILLPSKVNRGEAERSFFGVLRVDQSNDGKYRTLLHGTTLHGAERMSDLAATYTGLPLPLTYYHPSSPNALGVEVARKATGKHDGSLNVGVVGLGTGSMACAAKPGETWRFYEIDPIMVKVAQDPNRFTFMSRCKPDADVVMGDARLTVSREPAGRFDYMLIDAFSSDTVPVHIITREAIAGFLEKVAPNGIMAMHVSNRYMDLEQVAAATALSLPGLKVAIVHGEPSNPSIESMRSRVVFIARSDAALAPVLAWPRARSVTRSAVTPWTDDYSDILSAMWRKARE